MLDRLIDALFAIWKALLPWQVIQPYERAVLLRLGTFRRELGPGFHWIIPFHVDVVLNDHVTPRTTRLGGLSTTTRDGRAIAFDAVVTYRVHSIKTAILEVTDLKDAIADACAGQIGTTLARFDWEAIWKTEDALEALHADCRKRGFKWGVEILAVQLAGIALVKNLRITHGGQYNQPAGTTVHFNPTE